jgi:hypothetical protein
MRPAWTRARSEPSSQVRITQPSSGARTHLQPSEHPDRHRDGGGGDEEQDHDDRL